MSHSARLWSKLDLGCYGPGPGSSALRGRDLAETDAFQKSTANDAPKVGCVIVAVTFRQGTRVLRNPAQGHLLRGSTVQGSERPSGAMLPLVEAQETKSLSAHKVVVFR